MACSRRTRCCRRSIRRSRPSSARSWTIRVPATTAAGANRRPPRGIALEPYHDLAVRFARFHEAMRLLDLLEAEHARRLRPVDPRFDALDDRLERDLGERKLRRAGHERAREHAEAPVARHLEC